jgi:hypothetical protein
VSERAVRMGAYEIKKATPALERRPENCDTAFELTHIPGALSENHQHNCCFSKLDGAGNEAGPADP